MTTPFRWAFWMALSYLLSPISLLAQGTPIATTAFTRTMLRGADSAAVRTSLGFLTTNNTVITNYTGDGAAITNLNATELRSGTVPLARLSGITASQIAATTITTNNVDSTFYNLVTNRSSSGDVTQAGLAAGSYGINAVSVTNIAPNHLNQSQMLWSNLKLANACQTYNLPNVFGVFAIGDNAIPAASGASFTYALNNGLRSFLPYGGSIFGGLDSSGGVFNSAGTATFIGGSGSNPVWHGGYWNYATGQGVTNISTDGLGVTATHLVLNCVQANGFGSFQIYTQRVGGTFALFKTVNNNNAGAWTAFTTNCWLGGLITNVIAAVVSTGTNISYGQVACGLYSTNVPSVILDANFVGSGSLQTCMTNATHSNAVAVLLKPYFDAVIWSDLNTSNELYGGAKLFNNMMLPTAADGGWHTDFCLMSGSPDTNNPATPTTRSAALQVGFDYGIPVFDSYAFLSPNTPSRLYGLVATNDVHFTNWVGKMIGGKLVNWLGWSWPNQIANNYTALISLPYVSATNPVFYGTLSLTTTNGLGFVVSSSAADQTAIWMGLPTATALTTANAKMLGDNSGVTRVNGSSYIFNTISGTPYYYLSPSGGSVLGTVFDDSSDPGAGKVRFNGVASFTGNIYASNSIAISTNFVGANFTPASAFTKLSGSNNAAYGINVNKTNLISAP
jgi:hypothetical protein